MNSLHKAITDRIDSLADTLLEVSHAIHARPELAFEEFHACELLSRTLKDHDLPTQTGVFTLDTAFEAGLNAESLGPTVALLAEYDALPGIGHACGHNLIATAALGATLGLQAVQEQLPGRVRLIGTPAEEKGGGKELMARAGAFEAVDAAMMIHPAGLNLATMPCICVAEVEVIYHGRSAHASVSPHRGINALDGLLLAYQSISNLRQHIRDGERIHGIITEGGQAPNIVPERAVGDFYVRAADETALANLKPRVQACFEAGAKGSGCKVEINWAKVDYLDLNTNWPLADVFQKHGECLGREFLDWEELGGAGSTDMGNVSHRVPAIHPLLAAAPRDVVIHNPEFAKWAGSAMGDAAALDGAKLLAMTAADFLTDGELRRASAEAFHIAKGLA
ncbi:MAG: M20 family metallopeptidase [Gammaproteobacteria bacterium]|nr:M20 family metallopeptidase [Gammaproteobacteria bacterium]MCY4343926.1 M20 family metallopeptidase [Gammaproteobacteria bacterium]